MEKPRFAAFDIDQTMYRWSLFLDLIDILIEHGLMQPSVREGASEEKRRWENREGTYDEYIEKQVRLFCDYSLRGQSETDVSRVAHLMLQRKQKRQYLFTRELHKTLRALGYKTVAISGSPIQVVKIFAEQWGFDHWFGTEPEVDDRGRFTGDDAKTVRSFTQKGILFSNTLRALGCSSEGSVAVGDTMSDFPMLAAADRPIAFNPDKELRETARIHALPVVVERTSVVTVMRSHVADHPSPLGSDGLMEVGICDVLPRDVGERLRINLQSIGVILR